MQFIDLNAQYRALQAEIDANIRSVLSSAQFIGGPFVRELEERLREQFRQMIQTKYRTICYGPEEDKPYTLLYNRVLALLLSIGGVDNFSALTVNGGTEDLVIPAGAIPVLEEVTVT